MKREWELFCVLVCTPGPPERADAIVVLCGEDMKPRAKTGFDLFKLGVAPLLVLSGGRNDPPIVEGAEAARSFLAGAGLATDRLIVEAESQNTYEQAVNIITMAVENNWSRLHVVASQYHMPRAMLTFIQTLHSMDLDRSIRLIPVRAGGGNSLHECPEGLTRSRLSLLASDVDKAVAYVEHVASPNDGLEYFAWWAKHVAA